MKNLLFLLLLVFSSTVYCSNLKISEPVLYRENDQAYAVLNIQWDNAWKNDTNHDAVWLFFKFLRGDRGNNHVKISQEGHEVAMNHISSGQVIAFDVPDDQMGVFISSDSKHRSPIHLTVKIFLDKQSFEKVDTRSAYFKAYAIEMVHIPAGPFYVGDVDSVSTLFGGMFQSGSEGQFDGLYQVSDEKGSINISTERGDLYYQNKSRYSGDQKGSLGPDFPKGVQSFYIMKYEITHGQYAAFLNSISATASQSRVNFGGKDYYSKRGSIRIKDGTYVADFPNATCNYMSWDDAMAYADWSALRPMTELEFTKASRGPEKPMASAFPWGSNSKDGLQRAVNENGELVQLNGWDESKLNNSNKAIFGASYYWVMDLAGGLWERVVTIGDETGRAFKGTHGDGRISNYGYATNDDWPKGSTETEGFGFRGGGFYGYGRDYHEYNPFSPTSYRVYGAWSGGARSVAYGTRFVRGGDKNKE